MCPCASRCFVLLEPPIEFGNENHRPRHRRAPRHVSICRHAERETSSAAFIIIIIIILCGARPVHFYTSLNTLCRTHNEDDCWLFLYNVIVVVGKFFFRISSSRRPKRSHSLCRRCLYKKNYRGTFVVCMCMCVRVSCEHRAHTQKPFCPLYSRCSAYSSLLVQDRLKSNSTKK